MALQSGQLNAQTWQERQTNSANDRMHAISTAWDYYEGRHPLPLTVKPNTPDDNVIINLARPIVDKGISLLFGKEVTWQVDETDTETSDVEQFLRDVWDANKKMTLLHEVAQNGALAGLCAVKVDPRPDDKQRPYRLINLDPSNLEIFTKDEDIDDVWRYRIQYTCADASGKEMHKRQDITRDAGGQFWLIENFVCQGADMRIPWAGDLAFKPDGAPIEWRYSLPPIVHCKNLPCANAVWGYGDLEDVRLNDALNLIASSTRKIIRIHGSPQTLAKGFDPAMLRRDANQIWEIPEGGDLDNLELTSDLEASRKFYLELRTAFYAQGRMPDVAQVGNLGALTNFGLRVLFADALERTSTKQMMYGDLIVGINKLLCLLEGKGDNVTTKLTWGDPLPVNKLENVQTVQAELATGLTSNETLSGDLGRDYTDEQTRLADEKKKRLAAAPKPPPTLLPGSTPPDPNAPAAPGAPADPNTPTADGRVAPAATVPAGDPAGALKLAQGAK